MPTEIPIKKRTLKAAVILLLTVAMAAFQTESQPALRITIIGGIDHDKAYAVCWDGEAYLIAGSTKSCGQSTDIFLVRVSEEGELIWARTFGGPYEDRPLDVCWDGEAYLVVGFTYSSWHSTDVLLLRVSRSGELEWARTIGGTNEDAARAVCYDPIGRAYLVAGYTDTKYQAGENFIIGNRDILLIKISRGGELEWARTIGGPEAEEESAYSVCFDGRSYVIVGYYRPETSQVGGQIYDADVLIVRISKRGLIEWARTIGGPDDEYGTAVCWDGEAYLVAGHTWSYGQGRSDMFIIRVSESGSPNWGVTLGGQGDDEPKAVCWDGEAYLVAGYTESYGQGGLDIFLARISRGGLFEWARTIGGLEDDSAMDVCWNWEDDAHKIYTVVGHTELYEESKPDILLASFGSPIPACDFEDLTVSECTPNLASGGMVEEISLTIKSYCLEGVNPPLEMATPILTPIKCNPAIWATYTSSQAPVPPATRPIVTTPPPGVTLPPATAPPTTSPSTSSPPSSTPPPSTPVSSPSSTPVMIVPRRRGLWVRVALPLLALGVSLLLILLYLRRRSLKARSSEVTAG